MNRTLPDAAKITRFANLYKEFDADDDELTRTRKIRRAFVENRYKNIIDTLYSGEDMLHMETNITYEDGRVSRSSKTLRYRMCLSREERSKWTGTNLRNLLTTGVMLGSIFALVALGWVLIYKCSGVLNLAMGELTLIGGYVCLGLYQRFVEIMPITSAFIFALIGTMIIGLILGLLTERIFLRKMIGEPILAVIMVTVGLSFFFKGMVFMIWDTDTQIFFPRVFSMESDSKSRASLSERRFMSGVSLPL